MADSDASASAKTDAVLVASSVSSTGAPSFKVVRGMRLEARDFGGLWYPAKVIEVDEDEQEAHVHFEGWSARFDERIPIGGDRLRPLLRQSQRRDSDKAVGASSLNYDFDVGAVVLARWTDCRMYPAKIQVVNANSYDVVFYDGFKKTVQATNVKPMTKEARREFSLPDDRVAAEACLFGERKKSFKAKSAATSGTRKDVLIDEDGEKKGKKRKRTVTLESPGDAEETIVATLDPSESETGSPSILPQPFNLQAKKGRGRPPLVDREGAGGIKRAKKDSHGPSESNDDDVSRDEWRCAIKECGKSFRKESLLNYHLKYYHHEEKATPAGTSAPFKGTSASEPKTPITMSTTKTKTELKSEDRQSTPLLSSTPSSAIDPPPPPPSRKRKRDVSLNSESTPPSAAAVPSPLSVTASTLSDDDETFEFVTPALVEADSAPSPLKLPNDVLGPDDRIRCVCQIHEVTPESGRMLKCGRCQTWQHSMCFILPEDEDDESYLCYVCSHPPGIRDSKRRLEEVEDYLLSGELTRLPRPAPTSAAGALIPLSLDTRPRITYGKNDGAGDASSSSSNSLDNLAAVNLRGHESQAGFFKTVGAAVNAVAADVRRVEDCLHGTKLRMHRLKALVDSKLQPPAKEYRPTTSSDSKDNDNTVTLRPEPDWAALLTKSAEEIGVTHDALERRLDALEAEMDAAEEIWDASDEFVSLPPGKRPRPSVDAGGDRANDTSGSTPPVAGQKALGDRSKEEVENTLRIKRALRGLVADLNTVQRIAFLRTVKE